MEHCKGFYQLYWVFPSVLIAQRNRVIIHPAHVSFPFRQLRAICRVLALMPPSRPFITLHLRYSGGFPIFHASQRCGYLHLS